MIAPLAVSACHSRPVWVFGVDGIVRSLPAARNGIWCFQLGRHFWPVFCTCTCCLSPIQAQLVEVIRLFPLERVSERMMEQIQFLSTHVHSRCGSRGCCYLCLVQEAVRCGAVLFSLSRPRWMVISVSVAVLRSSISSAFLLSRTQPNFKRHSSCCAHCCGGFERSCMRENAHIIMTHDC